MRICRKFTCIENDVIRLSKFLKLRIIRPDEHIVHEQSMIGTAGNNSDLDAVFRIPPCKTIGDVESVTNIQVIDCPFPDNQKSVFINPDIDIAPPYVIDEFRSGNDSLVFRASSCFF